MNPKWGYPKWRFHKPNNKSGSNHKICPLYISENHKARMSGGIQKIPSPIKLTNTTSLTRPTNPLNELSLLESCQIALWTCFWGRAWHVPYGCVTKFSLYPSLGIMSVACKGDPTKLGYIYFDPCGLSKTIWRPTVGP